ncbi:MFS transporter, partial [Streptomyces sp. WAC 05379]
WWVLTGCGVLVLVVGLVTSGRWARGTAERAAETLAAPEIRDASRVVA